MLRFERVRVDAVIIGGGIAGCSAAWSMARRGMSVCLLERGAVGSGASGVNFSGVRQQGRNPVELPLARRSRAIWGTLATALDTDIEFRVTGHIKLAFDEAGMAGLEQYARTAAEFGLALELIGAAEARDRHPWLGPHVYGASLCVEDGSANPRLVVPAIARAARRCGADIREFMPALSVASDGIECVVMAPKLEVRSRILVNAAGAWGAKIASQFGESVPLAAIAPNCMVSEPAPSFMDRSVGICGGGVALRQTEHGSVVIGGGESHVATADGHAKTSTQVCRAVLERAIALVPRLSRIHIVRAWAGIEGDTPDHLPVLGPSSRLPGLIHAYGFSQHGFQLGPAVGEAVADMATRGAPTVDIGGMAIDRFAVS